MGTRNDKTYQNSCDECREIEREFWNEDMKHFVYLTEKMIDEKFQTRQDIIEDVRILIKDMRGVKIMLTAVTAAFLVLILYIFGL